MSQHTLFRGAEPEGWFARIRGGVAALLEPAPPPGELPEDAPVRFSALHDSGLTAALADQTAFAWAELRRDPAGFVAALAAPDPLDRRSRRLLWAVRFGVPAAALGAFGVGVGLSLLLMSLAPPPVIADDRKPDLAPLIVTPVPPEVGEPDAKPSRGGGGGGEREPAPVPKGITPPSSLADPIAPATAKPTPRPPDPLPIPPPIKAPPVPAVDLGRFGDPNSESLLPSNGPGDGDGAGTGDGGGWGPGKGPGEGPGEKGGRGRGSFDPGGRVPPDASSAIAVKAQILNSPRPAYTEAARKEKTQGTVRVSVLLGADGRVKQAKVTRGLPNGLDEKAIQAVYQLAFRPARDGQGRPVDSWVTVNVGFTIR